jgi:SprT protein
MTNLQKKAVEQTSFWIELANELYSISLRMIPVSFCMRGRSAGQFRHGRGAKSPEIRYNGILLEENGDQFLNRTVPHEVAHYVVRSMYPGAKPHGWEWKRIMHDFGIDSKRCHSYDTANSSCRRRRSRAPRVYGYRCRCRTHMLTAIRHRRIQDGKVYSCKHCRSVLTYLGVLDQGMSTVF